MFSILSKKNSLHWRNEKYDVFTYCLHKIVYFFPCKSQSNHRNQKAQTTRWCNAILERKREMLHVGPITSQWTLISSTNFVDCFPKRTNFEKPINFNFWPAANLGGGWDGDAFSLVFWVNWQYTLYIASCLHKVGNPNFGKKKMSIKKGEIN